jgi:hypothetical protein
MRSPNAETPATRDYAGNGRPEIEMLGGSRVLDTAADHTEQEQKRIGEAIKLTIADFCVRCFATFYLARLISGVTVAVIRGAPR